MGAIDAGTFKRNKAQFQSRHSGMAAPPTPSAPSTSAPSTSAKGVTLDTIMVQFQRMNARLDTLSIELYQVNTRVGHIARRQACLGGFMESPSPPPEASEDNDGSDDDNDDKYGDVSSSNSNEMST